MATKKDKAVAVREAVDIVIESIKSLEIKNECDYQEASAFLVQVKTTQKQVDEYFEADLEKAKIVFEGIKKEKQKLTLPLQKAESAVKQLISGYMKKAREEAERQAVREAKKVSKGEAFVVVAPKDPVPKAEGVTGVDHWGFHVTDEAQIPREYLTPDLKKIGALVRAMKGQIQIPGVKITHDVVVRAGTAS